MTSLLFTHLRFTATAVTDVVLGGHYAGNNLRNALANTMLHATCPEQQRDLKPTAEHAARCPVCWLLAAEVDPGSVVRAYAVIPPQPPRQVVPAGEHFSFGLTLFGHGWRYFPYVVLAANEMGRGGVGSGRREGKGRFRLEQIASMNPLNGLHNELLKRGETLVKIAPAPVSFADSKATASVLAECLAQNGGRLTIRFHSPLRLVEKGTTLRTADFAVLFKRLLYRIDDLSRQFAAGERRPAAQVMTFERLAERVTLLEDQTEWVELWSWSGRKQDRTPVGGLVGSVTYHAEDWDQLLPWLIFGQGTQLGKSTVKGLGVYSIVDLRPGYWHSLTMPPATA